MYPSTVALGNNWGKHLTYHEQLALRAVVEEIGNRDSATVVASSLADKCGVTRSTMVQALRLAAVAGCAAIKSKGAYGTHIRIRDRDSLRVAAGM